MLKYLISAIKTRYPNQISIIKENTLYVLLFAQTKDFNHRELKNLLKSFNVVKMCNKGVVGFMAIAVYSVYQFAKLKRMGYGIKECLIRVSKQAAFSTAVLIVSIIAQGIWGGPARIIVKQMYPDLKLVIVDFMTLMKAAKNTKIAI